MVAPSHRIMSLTEPTHKMSKSHKSDKSRILITDTTNEIRSKVASALTDSLPGITYEPTLRPGISNLLDILSVFDEQSRTAAELAVEHQGLSLRQLKNLVSDAVILGLQGIRDRYQELISSDNYLRNVEEHGAKKARQSAEETMGIVKAAMGF